MAGSLNLAVGNNMKTYSQFNGFQDVFAMFVNNNKPGYVVDIASGESLDEFNGKFAVTPEYPNGTYAYFMTENGSGDPVYPYVIGPKYYGAPIFEGQELQAPSIQYPSGAGGEVILNDQGQVSYVKMTKNGDGYFGPTQAKILGGEGGEWRLCLPLGR